MPEYKKELIKSLFLNKDFTQFLDSLNDSLNKFYKNKEEQIKSHSEK